LRDSIPFVEQISFLISMGKSRNGTNSLQARSHVAIIAGYFGRRVAATSVNRSAATLGLV
jgi:hypothetical protein